MNSNWFAFVECALLGHDDKLRRAPGRLYLHCDRCGRDTHGWALGSRAEPGPPQAPSRVLVPDHH